MQYPGKSILKASSSQDGDSDLTMDHVTAAAAAAEDPSHLAENSVSALDVTETFSGTTYVAGKIIPWV